MLKKTVLFIIANIGDYHAPRLLELQNQLDRLGIDLLVIEGANRSQFYGHTQDRASRLKTGLNVRSLASASLTGKFSECLSVALAVRPMATFVLGYNDPLALAGLFASKLRGGRVYFTSDSKADDQPRSMIGEWVKSLVVMCFDGALVAGQRHRRYFSSLGLRADRVQIGYDVVDNKYFSDKSALYRKLMPRIVQKGWLPSKYILVVSRLVPRKRVSLALKTFSLSRLHQVGYSLVIVGSGPELNSLEQMADQLGIKGNIVFIANVQNRRMPAIYAGAKALLLCSEYDQWGLCVNEAMACGVPVLVTERCGCANEIVLNGQGGYVWNGDPVAGAELLKAAVVPAQQIDLSTGAREAISGWGLARFASSAIALLKTDKLL